MKLRDVSVSADSTYERRKDFNLETHCISSLYLSYLPDVDSGPFKKAIVRAAMKQSTKVTSIETMIDVALVQRQFDFDLYWKAPKAERKKMVLDLLHAGLLDLARHFDWGADAFRAAHDRAMAVGLDNSGFWKKPVHSPNRQLTAQVFYSFDVDGIDIFVVFRSRDSREIDRLLAVKTPPHDMYLAAALGRLKWISVNAVELVSRDTKKRMKVSLPAAKASLGDTARGVSS
jgi:hypothetical protein